jgi:hypothetical protein
LGIRNVEKLEEMVDSNIGDASAAGFVYEDVGLEVVVKGWWRG